MNSPDGKAHRESSPSLPTASHGTAARPVFVAAGSNFCNGRGSSLLSHGVSAPSYLSPLDRFGYRVEIEDVGFWSLRHLPFLGLHAVQEFVRGRVSSHYVAACQHAAVRDH